jgi:hypothetical protein
MFLKGKLFTGRRIETAVLLLLSVFVAAGMFTDIPLLLQKRPICQNIFIYFQETYFLLEELKTDLRRSEKWGVQRMGEFGSSGNVVQHIQCWLHSMCHLF